VAYLRCGFRLAGARFQAGFGQIESQGSYGYTLTDADGTRHQLVQTSTNNYDTQDALSFTSITTVATAPLHTRMGQTYITARQVAVIAFTLS